MCANILWTPYPENVLMASCQSYFKESCHATTNKVLLLITMKIPLLLEMYSEFKGESRQAESKKTPTNPYMTYVLPRAKTFSKGILQRAEMTLNILEDNVLGIHSKNPLRTWKSKRASTMIIGPLKNNYQSNYGGKSACI